MPELSAERILTDSSACHLADARNGRSRSQLHIRPQSQGIGNLGNSVGVLDQICYLLFGRVCLNLDRKRHVLGSHRLPAPIRLDPDLHAMDDHAPTGCFAKDVIAEAAANRKQKKFAAAESQSLSSGLLGSIDRDRSRPRRPNRQRAVRQSSNLDYSCRHVDQNPSLDVMADIL